jgi:uroporphyrinogen-III synthase
MTTLRSGVLLTRPLADSLRIAGMIDARGFIPVVAPVMQVRLRAPALPHAVQAVLVTSGNAVDAVTPWDVPVFAVGDATAARVTARGFANVTSAAGDAAALVSLVSRVLQPQAGPVLLLSGAGQGHAAAASLRAAGFRVLRRVTYAAGPVSVFPAGAAAALAEDTVHAAIFLSAETAAVFVRLLPASSVQKLQGVVALAIGKAAADALKPLPWRQVRLACTPTLDHVLALL